VRHPHREGLGDSLSANKRVIPHPRIPAFRDRTHCLLEPSTPPATLLVQPAQEQLVVGKRQSTLLRRGQMIEHDDGRSVMLSNGPQPHVRGRR